MNITDKEIEAVCYSTGMSEIQIKKAIKKVETRQERRANRLLKNLTPNEIWNEFSRSNLHLPRYSMEDLPDAISDTDTEEQAV